MPVRPEGDTVDGHVTNTRLNRAVATPHELAEPSDGSQGPLAVTTPGCRNWFVGEVLGSCARAKLPPAANAAPTNRTSHTGSAGRISRLITPTSLLDRIHAESCASKLYAF